MRDAEHPENPAGASPEGGIEETQTELAPEDWQDSSELGCAEISAQEMVTYGSTVRRVEKIIVVAGSVCAVAAVWPLGRALAGGMLLGTLLGWVNFRWLASSVNAIGERIVKIKSRERGAGIVARGIGRIFLIAVFAYVIFTCSVRGLVGFLAGLAMPVVAMMCEAVYEFVASGRRPS
ncbi:MAG TPA: ATP synthase subunit I [Candidatus Saccharimonadales bacterium]|nr:ATP synthase subunit I [Candidatus Saccharimonadales bacterium]